MVTELALEVRSVELNKALRKLYTVLLDEDFASVQITYELAKPILVHIADLADLEAEFSEGSS